MNAMSDGEIRKAEIVRWWAAFSGIGLWFLYFEAQFAFMKAGMRSYCAPREAVGELCNYDYLPVMELIFIPICLVLFVYPFARFAFGVFAPPFSRCLRWRLAGNIDAATTFPFLQIAAALGLFWSVFRLSVLPIAYAPWFGIAYWVAWIFWFVAAIIASWPRRKAEI